MLDVHKLLALDCRMVLTCRPGLNPRTGTCDDSRVSALSPLDLFPKYLCKHIRERVIPRDKALVNSRVTEVEVPRRSLCVTTSLPLLHFLCPILLGFLCRLVPTPPILSVVILSPDGTGCNTRRAMTSRLLW